ncbi:MAG TPA: hypothetical protein VIM67_11810 [Terriglobus sp.]
MATLTEILLERLNSVNAQKLEISQRIAALSAEAEKLSLQAQVYELALNFEGKSLQNREDSRQITLQLEEDKPTSSEPISKANRIRQFILERHSQGVLASQVAHFVRSNGISPHGAFAYNAIRKMFNRGELTQLSDGRYIPTSKMKGFLQSSDVEDSGSAN